ANEIVINTAKAQRSHARVGDHIRIGIFHIEDLYSATPDHLPTRRLQRDFTVVGIIDPLDDAVRAADDPNLSSLVLFTPALDREIAAYGFPYLGKDVLLQGGATAIPAFEAAVTRLFDGVTIKPPGEDHATPVNMNFKETSLLSVARAHRAIQPYVVALWLFGA